MGAPAVAALAGWLTKQLTLPGLPRPLARPLVAHWRRHKVEPLELADG